jgi:hypothetical protein
LRATNLGTQAENNARQSDDKTRTDLISSIYAGLSGDSATQQAYESMQNNSKTAQDEANLASLGGFFDALKQSQQQQAYLQGVNSSSGGGGGYYKSPYSSGNSSYNGTVR